jgi:hypothetical protein
VISSSDTKCSIFFRENLIKSSKNKSIENIIYQDFKSNERRLFLVEYVVLFIDTNGDTKILKNRYGKEGIIK